MNIAEDYSRNLATHSPRALAEPASILSRATRFHLPISFPQALGGLTI
jgi:hypothetical protein